MKKNYLWAFAMASIILITSCVRAEHKMRINHVKEKQATDINVSNKSLRLLFDKQGNGTNFDTPWWNRGDLYKVITFRSLFIANPDLTDFKEDLLESFKISDDGKKYEFKLKDGLKWSDGSDLTGEDVKFSIEGAIKANRVNSIFKSAFLSIKGANDFKNGKTDGLSGLSVDGNLIKLEMDKVLGNMIAILSQFAILPKAGFEGVDMENYHLADFWRKPITNGMYKVEELETDSYIKLVKNEYYEKKPAKIQSVVINIVPSDAKLNAVVSNQADVFNSKVPSEIEAVASKDNWQGQNVDTLYYYYLVFNQTGNEDRPANKWIKNPKFRQAIYYAIDRQNLAKDLFCDLAQVTSFGVPEKDEANKNTEVDTYAYNPEKAKEILDDLGYKSDKPLEFCYYIADEASVNLYNSIKKNLEDVGIKVNIKKFKDDASYELMKNREYDIALKGLSAFSYEEWYGEYVPANKNLVRAFGKDVGKKYEALYDSLIQERDKDKRAEILKKLQKIEEEDLSKEVIFMLKNQVLINTDNVDTKGAKFTNPWFAADIGFENWELK